MSIEAMKQALECMEAAIKAGDWKVDGACDPDYVFVCLRAAIEQAEKQPKQRTGGCTLCGYCAATGERIQRTEKQEPVAWQVMVKDEALKEFPIRDMAHDWCVHQKLSGSSYAYWIRPLYTEPPHREWQGLTDEEVKEVFADEGVHPYFSHRLVARAIEAKLKEKNT